MDYSLLVGIHDCTVPPTPDDDCVDSLGEEEGNGYISSDEVVDVPVSPTTGTLFNDLNKVIVQFFYTLEDDMPLPVGALDPAGTISPEAPEDQEHPKDSDATCVSPLESAQTDQVVPHGHQPCDTTDRTPLQATAVSVGAESTGIDS